MKHLLTLATGLAIVGSLLTSSVDLHGQGMLDRIKTRAAEAAKRKAEERAATKAAEATDRALEIAECTIAGNCPEKESVAPDPAPQVVSTVGPAAGVAASNAKPGEGAWKNYDFVPGERVLFT